MNQQNRTATVNVPLPNLSPKAQAVLNAAKEIFLSHGFNGATTDMIQKKAGVSKSTVYAHFATKEALFLAVIQHECASFTSAIDDIKFESQDLLSNLTRLGKAYLNIVLSPASLSLYRVVVAEAPRFPALGHMFFHSGPARVKQKIEQYITHAYQTHEIEFDEQEIENITDFFLAMLRSDLQLVALTHPDKPITSQQIDHWVTLAINTFVKAYGQ